MAELAGLAAGREPEGVDLPVPVQLPYEADPGTLTNWCIAKTRGSTCLEIFGALISMNAKYAIIGSADTTAAAADTILKELAEDVLGSESLESFLTTTTPPDGKPMVIAVSRLSCFRVGIGEAASPWNGSVYGFLGEVEGGQLPPMMKLPDGMSLRHALVPVEVRVPMAQDWDEHYGPGPPNARIPIEGNELMSGYPISERGQAAKVPYLQYLPRAWAPYFMEATTPEVAMRKLRQLMAAVPATGEGFFQQHVGSIERWMFAASMRLGNVGDQRTKPKVSVAWMLVPGLDRGLSRWAARRLAPFTAVAVPLLLAPPPQVMVARERMRSARGKQVQSKCFPLLRHSQPATLRRRGSTVHWSMSASEWHVGWRLPTMS